MRAAWAAAPPPTEATAVQPSADEGTKSRAGVEMLTTVGYGASTSNVRNLELAPYSLRLGLDVGYGWRSGFRVGAELAYGFGHSITQHRTSLTGTEYDLTADASSLSAAITVAYDVPLEFLILRYSLGVGMVAMHWDLSGAPASAFYDGEWESPTWGLFLAPGASLLWRRELLEVGVGFDYLVQTKDGIPTGLVGELLTGVKW